MIAFPFVWLGAKSNLVTVPAYEREGHPVRSHVRHDPRMQKKRPPFTDKQRALVQKHYSKLSDMAWASVYAHMAKGRNLMFPRDAHLDAVEEGIEALRRWDPKKGDWQPFVWQQMKAAVKHHWFWERTRGLGGREALRKLYLRLSEEERRRLITQLPEIEGEGTLAHVGTPSAEEMLQHGARLLSREQALAKIEERFGVNLRAVRTLLKRQKAAKHGRKQLEIERALRIFELRVRGYRFREIAKKFSVDVATVHRSYRKIRELMKQMGEFERRGMQKSALLEGLAHDRLARALARHLRAIQYGYPAEFLRENRELLVDLLIDMQEGPWS